tara:strand:- start:38142 stop:38942 length:801 start_codon:yes stop_codon:yes gene_type:complete
MAIPKINVFMIKKISTLLSFAVLLGTMVGCGSSKKEMGFKISTLESQVGQLKSQTQEARRETKKVREEIRKIKENREIDKELYCDSVIEANEDLNQEILVLKNRLYDKSLANGLDSIHPSLKKSYHSEHIPEKRKQMMEQFNSHYLSMCVRMKASYRLFSEQIIIEYELNPISKTFEGYIRHQYIPDMGADEYGFQRMKGFYSYTDKGTLRLQFSTLDGKAVDIILLHNPKNEIYNAIEGNEDDLEKINTKVVGLDQFYFAKCPTK